jgi:hypothetical protein
MGLVKITVASSGFLIISLFLYIIWINLTPGFYRSYGCCKYGYLTDRQRDEYLIKNNSGKDSKYPFLLCTLNICQPNALQQLQLYIARLDWNK